MTCIQSSGIAAVVVWVIFNLFWILRYGIREYLSSYVEWGENKLIAILIWGFLLYGIGGVILIFVK